MNIQNLGAFKINSDADIANIIGAITGALAGGCAGCDEPENDEDAGDVNVTEADVQKARAAITKSVLNDVIDTSAFGLAESVKLKEKLALLADENSRLRDGNASLTTSLRHQGDELRWHQNRNRGLERQADSLIDRMRELAQINGRQGETITKLETTIATLSEQLAKYTGGGEKVDPTQSQAA